MLSLPRTEHRLAFMERAVQKTTTVTTSQGAQASQGTGSEPAVAQGGPNVVRRIPRGGGQIILDRQGDQTVVTVAQLPPDVWRLVHGAEQTAFGLMGLLALIVIGGPFARMFARRSERRAQMAPAQETIDLRGQIEQLQQSIDTMAIEMERISESQRFQSKLLFEGRRPEHVPDGVS